jgi:hypothetical protein
VAGVPHPVGRPTAVRGSVNPSGHRHSDRRTGWTLRQCRRRSEVGLAPSRSRLSLQACDERPRRRTDRAEYGSRPAEHPSRNASRRAAGGLTGVATLGGQAGTPAKGNLGLPRVIVYSPTCRRLEGARGSLASIRFSGRRSAGPVVGTGCRAPVVVIETWGKRIIDLCCSPDHRSRSDR